MTTPPALTAQILVEALPYIQRFAGKSVVVKLGGAAIDRELDRALAQDVLLLRSVGVRCVSQRIQGLSGTSAPIRVDHNSSPVSWLRAIAYSELP